MASEESGERGSCPECGSSVDMSKLDFTTIGRIVGGEFQLVTGCTLPCGHILRIGNTDFATSSAASPAANHATPRNDSKNGDKQDD